MIDPKALERLHNSKDFLVFLEEVEANKDSLVRGLYGKSNEQLQQAAGAITALTDLLDEAQLEKLRSTWQRIEN